MLCESQPAATSLLTGHEKENYDRSKLMTLAASHPGGWPGPLAL